MGTSVRGYSVKASAAETAQSNTTEHHDVNANEAAENSCVSLQGPRVVSTAFDCVRTREMLAVKIVNAADKQSSACTVRLEPLLD